MAQQEACPRCQSDRVAHGTFVGGPTVGFVPDQTKVFRVSLDSPTISVQRKDSILCIECGLVWTNAADLRKALARIMHWGTDELKSTLGLSSDAAIVKD